MSIEENKALHRRVYEEIWNKGSLKVADEVIANDYIYHPLPEHRGRSGTNKWSKNGQKHSPTFIARLRDIIAEGDRVMTRTKITGIHNGQFMGIHPTGRRISVAEVAVVRIKDGKLIEEWGFPDMLDLMRQFGAVPSR